MNDFINSEPYIDKIYNCTCRDCGQVFIINAQYDKNGVPVSFISKYCDECNMKPKITGPNGSWGTINIESAKIAQKSVEGLTDDMKRIQTKFANVFYQNAKMKKEIDDFKSSQSELNEMTLKIFNATGKTIDNIFYMIIGLFVFDLGVVWYIIKH